MKGWESTLFTRPSYVGVVFITGGRQFSYAAVDAELKPMAVGQGGLRDVLAFVGSQQEAVVGVHAPPRLNQGLMAKKATRAKFSPPPPAEKFKDLRVAEYTLIEKGLSIFQTPQKQKKAAGWMQKGFRFYRKMEEVGYQYYPKGGDHQLIEVAPDAAFQVWLGVAPFSAGSLEGRLQRQLVLEELGMDVPEAMMYFEEVTRFRILQGSLPEEGLYLSGELQALAAAYLAWAVVEQPKEVESVGDKKEGQILVPKKSIGIAR